MDNLRAQYQAEERRHHEMQDKSLFRETLFSMARSKQRPMSVATEFMEDWEADGNNFQYGDDDEVVSEFEDESPRLSLHSSGGQHSITTLSSYEEPQTPRSVRSRGAYGFDVDTKQVEGPRGPHLFRSSTASSHSIEFQHALSLSPITPKIPGETAIQLPIALDLTDLTPMPPKKRDSGPFQYTTDELDTASLPEWSPEMVAQWMLNADVEIQACDYFVENDITGAILVTLKFEDLKEMGIPSFGLRTKIWEEIHRMRNIKPTEPVLETDIEDAPDRAARRELRRQDSRGTPKRGQSKRRPKVEDVISPLESVSIVGIEQMMPKPHWCSKGEACAKWKRNKRMMEAFKNDHPFVDMDGGVIMIAGDPGNPETAEAIKPADEVFRPVSDAIPSVVASSDVMGPGMPPLQYLAEATLRNLQSRDPQDNVRQFLDFQHQHTPDSSEVPPTPPFEIYPGQNVPRHGLQTLPKLSIPTYTQSPLQHQAFSAHPVPYRSKSAETSPEDITPTAPYRFGTPFSDMDVPVTAVPVGPISRDVSQSVPPNMNYRHNPAPPSRSMSRASARRPSFPLMPALDEDAIVQPTSRQSPKPFGQRNPRPLQAPPRVQYPWTAERSKFEVAIAPVPGSADSSALPASIIGGKPEEGVSFAGPMKKRKTKMLRHEWHEHYFTLRGTRLGMHKNAAAAAARRTLEYVDVDDYAIACSSLASGKLNAAFKAMSLRRNDAADVAAFSFQLIPQDQKGGVRLRKRDSSMPSSSAAATSGSSSPGEGTNGTGKTHHFAVQSRDDRIDWMRELMLAKAKKQKGEGFEVSVNGNMI